MSKETSSSFVLELPLKTSPSDSRELDIRLESARQLYNAALGEALKRLSLLKQSSSWSRGRELLKAGKKKEAKEHFAKARTSCGFSEYALHAFIGKLRNSCWIRRHVDSSTAQKIATKAFQAVKEFLFNKRGRPRFKARGRYRSLEGKSNVSGIRFEEGRVLWSLPGGKKLELFPLYDVKDRHGVEKHGLSCRTKYVRLVKKSIRGKSAWSVQLVQEGQSFCKKKNRFGEELVGLDIGPSTIAVVTETSAALELFCKGLESGQKILANLQKKMSRSRQKTNPDNYKREGDVRPGPKTWKRSKRYLNLAKKLAERQRRVAESRKRMHGELANRLLAQGRYLRTEKLSYKEFQKKFGRSVGFRSPGRLVSLLRRKAERAGGFLEEFSTCETRLSQTCHCGLIKKKKLSERWHSCRCGVEAQRDLYSAYLARYVERGRLDTHQASQDWSAAEPLLERAVLSLMEQASSEACFSSFGLGRRQSLSRAQGGSLAVEAEDVVGASREPLRACQLASRTPWL